MGRERVAGSPESSRAGTIRWAVMIESMPAAIAARNGGASSFSHCSRLCVMAGKPVWLSTSVSPCPGKCLAVAATPEPLVPGDLGGHQRGHRPAGRRRRTGRR